jgi:phosphoribosylamine--glycine ligase
MKVMVSGSGGRENALVWKIGKSDLVDAIICVPGNSGTEDVKKCTNVPISITDIDGLVGLATKENPDLVVVGPEGPLVEGLADKLRECGIPVFGPSKRGALLEGSKEFAKKLMKKYGIKTADYEIFTDPNKAKEYILKNGLSKVIKADGLTGGKGAYVYKSIEEAFKAIDDMMVHGIYGEAGRKIIIEDRLVGQEVSYQILTDGKTFIPLELVEDHKQLLDGDQGPNTGGMGALSPLRIAPSLEKRMREIADRFVCAMETEGIDYQGVCYIGFMIVNGELYVLEINCRFGDPETQVLMPRMKSDIVPILLACTNGTLDQHKIEWDPRPAVCVVLAARGYPDNPEKGKVIHGLESPFLKVMDDTFIFHAGTIKKDNIILTNGGRVLCVVAIGAHIKDSAKKAYGVVRGLNFEGMQYRKDIPRGLVT